MADSGRRGWSRAPVYPPTNPPIPRAIPTPQSGAMEP